jgi:ABC-type Fe3+ transport system permease subunit
MKLIPMRPSIWNPLGSPFKDVFIAAIIAIVMSVFIVYARKSSLRLKYKSAEAKQYSDEELNSMRAKDKDGIFKPIIILGIVTLAIILGILIQNSAKNTWASADIYNANKANAISQNTSKLEDYYGISNVQFSNDDDDILITSIGSSDAGLNNNDRKVNDIAKIKS